jgi:hypothetical protein
MENGRHDTVSDLSALADELLEQATEIRRQWAELGETLGIETPEPAPTARRREPEAAEADPVRLVALDMMLSGHSREAIRDYLRATFGEGDREAVLDEVFAQYGG